MIATLKRLLGISPATDFAILKQQGAQIIDVRTQEEFKQGHIKGAINIPLNGLTSQMSKLNKDKPVITCCASGVRSGQASGLLKSNGFTKVYNGGGWKGLQRQL